MSRRNSRSTSACVRNCTRRGWRCIIGRATSVCSAAQLDIAGQRCPYNNCRALYNQYNGITNFQPRIGIACNPWKNTVVRAAYTLSTYLEGTGTNLRLPINPPFAHENDANYTSLPLPGSTLSQGFVPLRGAIRRSVRRRHAARLGSQRPPGGFESMELHHAAAIRQQHDVPGRLRRPAHHAPDGADALSAERTAARTARS